MKLTRDDKRAKALIVRPRGTQKTLPVRQQTQSLNQFAGGSRPTVSIGSGAGIGGGRPGGAGALATVAAALAQPFLPPEEGPEVFGPQPVTGFLPPTEELPAEAAPPTLGDGDIPRPPTVPEGPAYANPALLAPVGAGDSRPTGPAYTDPTLLTQLTGGVGRVAAPQDRQSQGMLDPAIALALLKRRGY